MTRVVSFGSVNLDRTWTVDAETLERLRERDWFSAPGETRTITDPPDLSTLGEPERSLGGKGANDAVAAARLGADAVMVGAVGSDAGEYDVRRRLEERGVDTSRVRVRGSEPTGAAYVFVGPTGESHVARLRGANATVGDHHARVAREEAGEADALCLQNEIPADAAARLLDGLPEGPCVVLDPAPAEGVEALATHPRIDYLTPNETEYAELSGVLTGVDATVVVTRGAKDVVVREGGTEVFRVTPPEANVVDTTGAGDTFAGALATRLGEDTAVEDAVEFAAAASASATEAVGAQTAMPARSDLET